MKKKSFFVFVVFFIMFLPTIAQFLTTKIQNYWIGLIIRIFVHIIIPIIVIKIFYNEKIIEILKKPLLKNKNPRIKLLSKKLVIYGILISIFLIIGSTILLYKYINFEDIKNNLLLNFGVTKTIFPFIGLAIILINSTIEEYFWRGFIFRILYTNSISKIMKIFFTYFTGIIFALHHTIIFQGWFNLWQWLLVTIFLATVGIVFNIIYIKTKNIYTTWIIHAFADLLIVLIGFFLIFL